MLSNRTDLVQLFVRTPDSLRPNPTNASMAFALCSALYIRMVRVVKVSWTEKR